MAFLWLINGGDPTPLTKWDDPPKYMELMGGENTSLVFVVSLQTVGKCKFSPSTRAIC